MSLFLLLILNAQIEYHMGTLTSTMYYVYVVSLPYTAQHIVYSI